MTDDWRGVEEALYWLDQRLSWRPVVVAMRGLLAAIKADPRFHDLAPSMSHDALVLRRSSNPGVWVSWLPDDEAYEVAFIDPGFSLRDRRRAKATDGCLELLSEYLDHSPLAPSTAKKPSTSAWDRVEAEYAEIAEHYPSEATFVAAMRDLTSALRADARFVDVDPRIARGTSRAGGPLSSLVLRLLARRSVWCWWDTTETLYHVALVEGDVMLHEAMSANLAEVVDLLVADLEQNGS